MSRRTGRLKAAPRLTALYTRAVEVGDGRGFSIQLLITSNTWPPVVLEHREVAVAQDAALLEIDELRLRAGRRERVEIGPPWRPPRSDSRYITGMFFSPGSGVPAAPP
jgi:hypothetical protein